MLIYCMSDKVRTLTNKHIEELCISCFIRINFVQLQLLSNFALIVTNSYKFCANYCLFLQLSSLLVLKINSFIVL